MEEIEQSQEPILVKEPASKVDFPPQTSQSQPQQPQEPIQPPPPIENNTSLLTQILSYVINQAKKVEQIEETVKELRLDWNLSERIKIDDLRRELEKAEEKRTQREKTEKDEIQKLKNKTNWQTIVGFAIGGSSLSLGIYNTFLKNWFKPS